MEGEELKETINSVEAGLKSRGSLQQRLSSLDGYIGVFCCKGLPDVHGVDNVHICSMLYNSRSIWQELQRRFYVQQPLKSFEAEAGNFEPEPQTPRVQHTSKSCASDVSHMANIRLKEEG